MQISHIYRVPAHPFFRARQLGQRAEQGLLGVRQTSGRHSFEIDRQP